MPKRARIGKGAQGSVYDVDGVAVKVSKRSTTSTDVELRALRTLCKTPHENVVQYVRKPCIDSLRGRIHQYFELFDCDLFTLCEQSGGRLSEDRAREIFRKVASGLRHCHALAVFHMDLKPENILIKDDDRKVCLADFGCAIVADDEECKSPCEIGTELYALPEFFGMEGVSDLAEADVWAFGVSLFAMVVGSFPWKQASGDDPYYRHWLKLHEKTDARNEWLRNVLTSPVELSETLTDLFVQVFHPDRTKRLTLDGIIDHPWFRT